MKLEGIIAAVCEALGNINVDDVWSEFLVLRGIRSFGDSEPGFLYEPGMPPEKLRRDMEVDEPYVLFEEIGHYPLSYLVLFDSEAELERALLDSAGCLNPFTTRALCIKHGRLAPYEVFFRVSDGNEQRFDKNEQQALADPFAEEYPDARLVWL